MLNRRNLHTSLASLHHHPQNSRIFSTKVLKLLILLLVFSCLLSLPLFCLTLSRSHDSCHHSSAGLRSAFQALQAHRFIRFCSDSSSEICFLMGSYNTVGHKCMYSKSKTVKQLRNSAWNVFLWVLNINNYSFDSVLISFQFVFPEPIAIFIFFGQENATTIYYNQFAIDFGLWLIRFRKINEQISSV